MCVCISYLWTDFSSQCKLYDSSICIFFSSKGTFKKHSRRHPIYFFVNRYGQDKWPKWARCSKEITPKLSGYRLPSWIFSWPIEIRPTDGNSLKISITSSTVASRLHLPRGIRNRIHHYRYTTLLILWKHRDTCPFIVLSHILVNGVDSGGNNIVAEERYGWAECTSTSE